MEIIKKNISLRAATLDDIDIIVLALKKWMFEIGKVVNEDILRKEITGHIEKGWGALAFVDGDLAGVMSFTISKNWYDNTKYLVEESVWVISEYRDLGIGKMLYKVFDEFAEKSGCTHKILIPNRNLAVSYNELEEMYYKNGYTDYAKMLIKEV